MNTLTQPAKQRREFSRRDRRHQVRDIAARGLEQLRRDQRAERIGREIAPIAVVPMDVLKASLAIIARRHAEECTQLLGPSTREIGRPKVAGNHCPL